MLLQYTHILGHVGRSYQHNSNWNSLNIHKVPNRKCIKDITQIITTVNRTISTIHQSNSLCDTFSNMHNVSIQVNMHGNATQNILKFSESIIEEKASHFNNSSQSSTTDNRSYSRFQHLFRNSSFPNFEKPSNSSIYSSPKRHLRTTFNVSFGQHVSVPQTAKNKWNGVIIFFLPFDSMFLFEWRVPRMNSFDYYIACTCRYGGKGQ